VVFPQADFKFYLDATPEVSARPRCDQLLADGQQADYQEVLQAILLRDGRDRSRSVAPLIKPPGGVEIDTSGMTIAQVTDELARLVQAARP
jgi:cytidylate kinase